MEPEFLIALEASMGLLYVILGSSLGVLRPLLAISGRAPFSLGRRRLQEKGARNFSHIGGHPKTALASWVHLWAMYHEDNDDDDADVDDDDFDDDDDD
eukprot:11893198-Karenia_brevis.AAC.1